MLKQDFSFSTTGFLIVLSVGCGAGPVTGACLGSISGLYPLKPSAASPDPAVTTKNACRLCRMPPGQQNLQLQNQELRVNWPEHFPIMRADEGPKRQTQIPPQEIGQLSSKSSHSDQFQKARKIWWSGKHPRDQHAAFNYVPRPHSALQVLHESLTLAFTSGWVTDPAGAVCV